MSLLSLNGVHCFFSINIQNQKLKDMPTLIELIKESLEGKLTDQIRATLETEDSADNSANNKYDDSKPE